MMKHISHKIIVAIIACVLVSILVVGVIVTGVAQSGIESEARTSMQNLADSYANLMGKKMAEYEGYIRGFDVSFQADYDTSQLANKEYNDAFIAGMVAEGLNVDSRDEKILSVYAYINPDYQGDVSGFFISDGEDSGVESEDYAEYMTGDFDGFEFLYEAEETQEPFWMDPYYDSDLEETAVTYCIPVYKNDTFIAAIGLDISFEDFNDMVTQAQVYEKGSASLLNSEYSFIADTEYDTEDSLESVGLDQVLAAMEASDSGVVMQEDEKGKDKMYAYSILDNGFIFMASVSENEVMAAVTSMKYKTLAAGIAMVVIACLMALFVGSTISAPIRAIVKDLDRVRDGDFTGNNYRKYLKKKDETGHLAKSVNSMQQAMAKMVGTVNNENTVMNNVVSRTDEAVNALLDQISSISSVTESLAANMEETASTASQLSDSAEQMKIAVNDMSDSNSRGMESVGDISARAAKLKDESESEAARAGALISDVENRLKDALEQAKTIEEIKSLTGSIMKIASQTNLLALNASIESVKAGEAGKSFAVVAEEISHLADSSQQTAHDIQTVTENVIENVELLRETSEEMLNLMDEHVKGSYGRLISTSEQYSSDAENMKMILEEFSQAAASIYNETEALGSAAGNLKQATSEGAIETNDLAHDTEGVMSNTTLVQSQASELSETSKRLNSTISMFSVND